MSGLSLSLKSLSDLTASNAVAITTEQAARASAVAAVSAAAFGVGQIWNRFETVRALNVNYINTSGRPIGLAVRIGNSTGEMRIITTGSKVIASSIESSTSDSCLFAVIPDGEQYFVDAPTGNIILWAELR